MDPWLLIPLAYGLALGFWPLRRRAAPIRWGGTFAILALLLAMPWLADRHDLAGTAALALVAAAALPAKLLDGARTPSVFAALTLRQWLAFLAAPYVVCLRGHLGDPAGDRRRNVWLALRGLSETALGAAVLAIAFAIDFRAWPLALEHGVKLAGLYLFALDGPFVAATGLLRLAGFRTHDLSTHPARAVTPADFWRRYNRDAGRFLFENIYRRLRGWSPGARTMAVFVANGLVHEYLSWIVTGRLLGYALAFFVIQGVATAATGRLRPTGRAAVLGWVLTLTFMAATSWLVLRAVDVALPWFVER